MIPSHEEQRKIIDFLRISDETIIFQQKIIAQLESLKKAYLQKMFI